MNAAFAKALALLLLATFTNSSAHAQGQCPPGVAIRKSESGTFLDYYPCQGEGAAMLQFSPDLATLRASNMGVFDVPSDSGLMSFDITSFITGPSGFFSVIEYPGYSAADFADPEPNIDAPGSPYFIQPLGGTGALADGSVATVNFQILDATTLQPLSISGSVTLDIKTISGKAPPFTAMLNPLNLPITMEL